MHLHFQISTASPFVACDELATVKQAEKQVIHSGYFCFFKANWIGKVCSYWTNNQQRCTRGLSRHRKALRSASIKLKTEPWELEKSLLINPSTHFRSWPLMNFLMFTYCIDHLVYIWVSTLPSFSPSDNFPEKWVVPLYFTFERFISFGGNFSCTQPLEDVKFNSRNLVSFWRVAVYFQSWDRHLHSSGDVLRKVLMDMNLKVIKFYEEKQKMSQLKLTWKQEPILFALICAHPKFLKGLSIECF